MSYLRYIMLYSLVFLIENSVITVISIDETVPDLSLIFLIFFSLKESQIKSTLAGFLIGLVKDIVSFNLVGLSSLAKTVSGFTTFYFQSLKDRHMSSRITLIVFVISWIHNVINQIILSIGSEFRIVKILVHDTVPGAIYTTVFAVIINMMFYRMIWSRQPH